MKSRQYLNNNLIACKDGGRRFNSGSIIVGGGSTATGFKESRVYLQGELQNGQCIKIQNT